MKTARQILDEVIGIRRAALPDPVRNDKLCVAIKRNPCVLIADQGVIARYILTKTHVLFNTKLGKDCTQSMIRTICCGDTRLYRF